MPTFTIICESDHPSIRSAIELTEELVERHFVQFARVQDDADPANPPISEPSPMDALAALDRLKGTEAVQFLYDQAKRAGHREGESQARQDQSLYFARKNHHLAAGFLDTACAGDQEVRFLMGRAARSLLAQTPMCSPYINDLLGRLANCNLNDSSKFVPLGVLESIRDLARKASNELGVF